MKIERRFGKRKASNPKKGLFLVMLLAIAIYLFINADKIVDKYF